MAALSTLRNANGRNVMYVPHVLIERPQSAFPRPCHTHEVAAAAGPYLLRFLRSSTLENRPASAL